MKKIVVILALTAFAVASHAGTLITGNLGTGINDSSANFSDQIFRAVGFTTPGSSFGLGSIVVKSTVEPVVSLYNNSSGAPGTVASTLNVTPLGNLEYSFSPGSTFTLAANTTYWVVMSAATSAGSGFWYANNSTTYTSDTSPAGSWFGQNKYQIAALSWNNDVNKYLVNVNAVPEPSQYAMLAGLGLIAFAFIRRKLQA